MTCSKYPRVVKAAVSSYEGTDEYTLSGPLIEEGGGH